ncbi:hypothetical protein P4I22_27665, partial [Escherichia coli]|nr:hypothetical protein [Escherichia coli]
DRNRSHWSTSKTPSYTKSVSWQHHPPRLQNQASGLASCNTSLTTQYFVLRMVTSQWWDRAGAS